MRAKTHQSLNLKLLLLGVLIAFILIFLLRSNLSSESTEKNTISSSSLSPPKTPNVDDDDNNNNSEYSSPKLFKNNKRPQACTKILPSSAKTLIHYATSTITPQQTLGEITVAAKVLEKRSPCNFLVFGLGHDSLMWATLNQGGRTLFLEEDEAWIKQVRLSFPDLDSWHVEYHSRVSQAGSLMEAGRGLDCMGSQGSSWDPMQSSCPLSLKGLPGGVHETEWDVIMVDAPTGYYEEAPGRMAAIYTAGMMARNRAPGGETDVFVHDVNRAVEDKFSRAFLCEGYMREQEGRLRHFKIPSHRSGDGSSFDKPFCPTID